MPAPGSGQKRCAKNRAISYALKRVFKSHLHDARAHRRRGDLPESRQTIGTDGWIGELRVVPDVEKLSPELDRLAFPEDGGRLGQRHVPIVLTGAQNGTQTNISPCGCGSRCENSDRLRSRRSSGKHPTVKVTRRSGGLPACGSVELAIDYPLRETACRQHVGGTHTRVVLTLRSESAAAAAAKDRPRTRVGYVQSRTVLASGDAGERPTLTHLAHNAVVVGKGNVPNIVHNQPLRPVVRIQPVPEDGPWVG